MIGNVDGIDNDHLQGWAFDEANPDAKVELDIYYNGMRFTSATAGFPRDDLAQANVGDGAHGFVVALPALVEPEDAEVEVRVAGSEHQIGETRGIRRLPSCSPDGILAEEMLRLHSLPLHSIQGFSFDGEKLVVTGMHLPPDGNPFLLAVRSTPGTHITLKYPILSPAVAQRYWYWPNARWSTFQVEIDLAASTASEEESDHFEFWFESDGSGLQTDRVLARNRVWIPKDMGTYLTFPGGDQLTRVHSFDSNRRVALAGYNDFRHIEVIAERYGVDLAPSAVLDWGCGHGRMIRHFAALNRVAEAWGVDIDSENVAWLQEHDPSVRATVVPLTPPTDLPDHHFDLVYGISVMTHLTRDVQKVWLEELRRITKPGGLVLLTFCGQSSVAFASAVLGRTWLDGWLESGFDDTVGSADLLGKIGDDEYYRNTKQSLEMTAEFWGEYFTVEAIHECMFGYQDLAILRA